MVFVMRKLDRIPQTLGAKLRALRSGQAVSLDMIEQRTHIQRRYLEALEHGYYDQLPDPLYTRNFIRAYARELNADEDYFIELYEEECGRCDLIGPMRVPRQRVKSGRFFVWHRLLRFSGLFVVAAMICTYLGWQISSIVAPPDVVLFSPGDEITTSRAIVTVEGMVEGESTVYVNGEEVIVNSDRTFTTDVDLQKGLNIITVEAERRYSKKATAERRVLFDPNEFAAGN